MTYLITQGLFVRLFGVIFFIAFASLITQLKGLYGSRGISPIKETLSGESLFLRYPTLFWWKNDDWFLQLCAYTGAIASLLVITGVLPALFLAIAWYLYLSFCIAGSDFLSFQWDALLIESGLVAVLFATLAPPPLILVYLLWFLLFRFMFSSGYAKLVQGSEEWRDLTAMKYHYETQPLPTLPAYYAHQLPAWFGKLSVVATHIIEVVVPFLIFTPIEIRLYTFYLLVGLQLLIILTGNFTFFNFLTITLCVPLLPDSYLSWIGDWIVIQPSLPTNVITTTILTLLGGGLFLLNVLKLAGMLFKFSFNIPYHIINSYGLFVHMTTTRNEIIIEGSNDGENWKEYPFKWKPGNLSTPPKIVAPHHPRLDWQMWFAALGSPRQSPWLSGFLHGLLDGTPEITALMKSNPFPDHPPKIIRAQLYRYNFTTLEEKKKTGNYWKRQYLGEFCRMHS